MLIEPSAMVVEGIGTQQVLPLLLGSACPLHDMRTKLWAFSQPGEEVVHIDIMRSLQGVTVLSCFFSLTHRVIPDSLMASLNFLSIIVDIMIYIVDEALKREALSRAAATGERQHKWDHPCL